MIARLSLRARLLLGVVVLAGACLAVVAFVVRAEQRSFLEQRVDDQLPAAERPVSRALAENGIGAPDVGPGPGPRGRGPLGRGRPGPGGPGPVDLPPGTYGERRDERGQRLGGLTFTYGEEASAAPRLPAGLDDGEVVTVPAVSGRVRFRAAAFTTPSGQTTIVAIPLSGVEEQLDRLDRVLLVVMGGALLALAALASLIVRVALRPLDAMGRTAGAIAAGDLSRRVAHADERTEVGRLGVALNTMLAQIEEAFREREASEERLRTFLSDASHELRTPLASIRGYAELFRIGAARDGEAAEKAMRRIEQEAQRMGVLVEDLLALARLDELREPEVAPVDLGELARDAADDARATAPDRAVSVHAAPGSVVQADEAALRQVLANLVRNALAHTPAGTPIELAVERADGRVRTTVRDHGPGLPVPDGAVLFERFWRDTEARGRGPAGAGLGLAIVHGIVTAHHGTVTAADAPGGGAVFTVELPARP